ncbi:uncharacterized protein LOC135846593 [Planococcus citri]|uniref:uncharacterized protein LOC135846593 n=1 Tax=Planococcus citri TaxID=170843 RepID=UPI0031F99595
MKYSVVVFCCVALATYGSSNASPPSSVNSNLGRNDPRQRREIPDECRMHFHRPPHHHDSSDESGEKVTPPPPPPVCCELPDLMSSFSEPEVFGKCHRYVHETLNPGGRRGHHRHGSFKPGAKKSERVARDVEETEDVNANKDSHVDRFQEKKECFMSCVFNSTGLLTDDAFNEELLTKKMNEAVGNDTKWASIVDPAFKKCLAAAKEANSQSQKTCKAGPAEYMKCFTRELFFNCPSDIWTTSPACTEFKEKLEKCPNLMPFPPHRPHHHGHHHHHHHHNKHHRKPNHSDEKPEEP